MKPILIIGLSFLLFLGCEADSSSSPNSISPPNGGSNQNGEPTQSGGTNQDEGGSAQNGGIPQSGGSSQNENMDPNEEMDQNGGDVGGMSLPDTGGAMTSFPSNVASCEEIESQSCFANADCMANEICYNVGGDDAEVPCCIPGERGTVEAGQPCSLENGQLECASALCIGLTNAETGVCSQSCQTDDECPSEAPRCISIAFSESDFLWCFPDSSNK